MYSRFKPSYVLLVLLFLDSFITQRKRFIYEITNPHNIILWFTCIEFVCNIYISLNGAQLTGHKLTHRHPPSYSTKYVGFYTKIKNHLNVFDCIIWTRIQFFIKNVNYYRCLENTKIYLMICIL